MRVRWCASPMGGAILRSMAMTGAVLLALALDTALTAPHPDVRMEGDGGEIVALSMIAGSTRGCRSTDLPAVLLLQPHSRNRRITYSWRVLPAVFQPCI